MFFKCKKCLIIKYIKCFTIATGKEKICDSCCEKIEDQRVKREDEIQQLSNCKNKTPILTGYGETEEAKKSAKIRRAIEDAIEDNNLAKELIDYE